MFSPKTNPTRTSYSPGGSTCCSKVVFGLLFVARVIYLVPICVAPWLFAGVWADSQYFLYCGILGSLAVWIFAAALESVTERLRTSRLPLVLLPISSCLFLCYNQLAPLPEVHTVGPSHGLINVGSDENQRIEADKNFLIKSMQSRGTIFPAATRLEMARLIFAIIALFLATQLFVTVEAQFWLWGSLAANGSALALFGITQQLSWNGKMFWVFPMRHGGQPFASFVNRNNAAGFLCLCVAGALGLAIRRFSKPPVAFDSDGFHNGISTRSTRVRRNMVQDFLRSITDSTIEDLAIGCALVLTTSGVVMTCSRGGLLALAVSMAVVCPLIARLRGLSIFAFIVGIVILCAAFIVWTGQGDRVSKRWAQSVTVDAIFAEGRWIHWRDAFKVVQDFPQTGTGIGTYRFGYLPYQTHQTSHRFYNADNQFLEWLVEGGACGFSAVILSIFLIAIAIWACLGQTQIEFNDPVGHVGMFALASQCVSGFFDFGPTMPANFLALVAIIGAVTGRAAYLIEPERHGLFRLGIAFPRLRPSILVPIFGGVLLFYGVIHLREVEAAAAIDAVVRDIPKLDSPDSLHNDALDRIIQRLTVAIEARYDDAEAHQTLAELWIYKFRLQEFQKSDNDLPKDAKAVVWQMTSPIAAYELIQHWKKTGQNERIRAVIESPEIQATLAPAWEHLTIARGICPMIPDIDRSLAKIAFIDPKEPQLGQEFLRRAIVLAPVDPDVYYEVGSMAFAAELTELSFSCWRRSLSLSPRHLLAINRSLSETLTIEEQLDQVIPASPELIIELGQNYSEEARSAERFLLADRAIDLLSKSADTETDGGQSEAERLHNMGRAKRLLDASDEAVASYRRALAIAPKSVEVAWRLELVEILIKRNQLLPALKEAEICELLEPGRRQHQALVRNLRELIPTERRNSNSPAGKRKSR